MVERAHPVRVLATRHGCLYSPGFIQDLTGVVHRVVGDVPVDSEMSVVISSISRLAGSVSCRCVCVCVSIFDCIVILTKHIIFYFV